MCMCMVKARTEIERNNYFRSRLQIKMTVQVQIKEYSYR